MEVHETQPTHLVFPVVVALSSSLLSACHMTAQDQQQLFSAVAKAEVMNAERIRRESQQSLEENSDNGDNEQQVDASNNFGPADSSSLSH